MLRDIRDPTPNLEEAKVPGTNVFADDDFGGGGADDMYDDGAPMDGWFCSPSGRGFILFKCLPDIDAVYSRNFHSQTDLIGDVHDYLSHFRYGRLPEDGRGRAARRDGRRPATGSSSRCSWYALVAFGTCFLNRLITLASYNCEL